MHTGDDTAPTERSQFSLKQLLLWTTAAAAILAIGRWIGLRDDHTVAAMTRMARDAAICGLVATVCLALVIPSISLILGKGKRGRAAAWLATMAVATTLANVLIVMIWDWSVNASTWADELQKAVECLLPLQAGYIATMTLSLVVARLCGFRLSRGPSVSAASEPSPGVSDPPLSLAPVPWWHSRFVCVVFALGLIVGALAWPSWMIEQERQESLRQQAVYKEWDDLGVDIWLQDEGIGFAEFQSQRPVSDLVLDKLRNSPGADAIYRLQFSGTSLTDDQMHYLAGFKNLEWLLLDGTQVSNAGLSHLRGMSKLRVLSLNGTRVDDEGLKALQKMSALEELGLNDTEVTDAGLVHLSSLHKLTTLGLARTRVTDQGLAEVRRLPKLQVLQLKGPAAGVGEDIR